MNLKWVVNRVCRCLKLSDYIIFSCKFNIGLPSVLYRIQIEIVVFEVSLVNDSDSIAITI